MSNRRAGPQRPARTSLSQPWLVAAIAALAMMPAGLEAQVRSEALLPFAASPAAVQAALRSEGGARDVRAFY
ncbi:MAG: hypothetical protein JWN69_727, partial [Alphaproteobacteria bacterium]|nr:hypothetical protein [Alphaproteobacteria bacterium]